MFREQKAGKEPMAVVAQGGGGPSTPLSLVLQEKPEVRIFVGDLGCFFKK